MTDFKKLYLCLKSVALLRSVTENKGVQALIELLNKRQDEQAAALEGSVSPAVNSVIYATSNRRHLLAERKIDIDKTVLYMV